jgi:geranylgeranyl reductase
MVVVAGGGPAGAVAAYELASAGREVIVVEPAPGRDKACGGGLPFRGVQFLDVPEALIEQRVTRIAIHGPEARRVDCDLSPGLFVGMVRRDAFDAWLLSRARDAGARVLVGSFEALVMGKSSVEVRVRTAEGEEAFSAHSLLGADGAFSKVRAAMGADPPPLMWAVQERVACDVPPDHARTAHFWFDGAIVPLGYAWSFPRNGELAVGVGTGVRTQARSLRGALQKVRHSPVLSPFADSRVISTQGHPVPRRPIRKRVADRVMLLGDAAGLVAPFTAEGILYAVWSARLAVEVLLRNWDAPTASALAEYTRRWDREHMLSWGSMRMFERMLLTSQPGRRALLDYVTPPRIGTWLVDAWAARVVRRGPGLSFVGTPARAVGCLLRRVLFPW